MPDIDRLLRHGVPIVAGVAFLCGSAWAHQRDEFEREHWVEQRVKVIETTRHRDNDEWAPIVEFEVNGRRVQHTGSYSASHPAAGSELTLRFDPAAPEQTARLLQPLEGLVVPGTLLMGLATLLTGIVGALRNKD